MTRDEAIRILKYNFNVIHKTINGETDPNEIEALDMAIKALEAQEQLANNSPELANNFGDLISRKAAIEALMEFDKKLRKIDWYQYPYMEHECRGVDKAIVKIANLPYAQPEQRWIPCDKGEPDEDMECWVTVKTTDALYRGNFTKRFGKGFVTSCGFTWWNTALAWMPIYEPEPYRTEGDDNHEG